MFEQFYFNKDGEKVYFHEEHGMRFEWMKAEDINWIRKSNHAKSPTDYVLKYGHDCKFIGYNIKSGKQWNGNLTTTVFEKDNILYVGPNISNLTNPNRELYSCNRIASYNKKTLNYYLNKLNKNFIDGKLSLEKNDITKFTAHTKFNVICNECGFVYPSHANILINMNSGCKKCYNKIVATRCLIDNDSLVHNANTFIKNKGYPYNIFDISYKNTMNSGGKYCILKIKCIHHNHTWKCSYNDFKNNESKCYYCFPSGYDSTSAGYFYIHEITSRISDKKYYKIGITKNLKQRLSQYNKNVLQTNEFKAFYCSDGKLIQSLEKYIKKYSGIQIGVLSKALYESGYTETINSIDLELILKIVKDFMNHHNVGSHIVEVV